LPIIARIALQAKTGITVGVAARFMWKVAVETNPKAALAMAS
jgi:hypothetical protein